MGEVREESAGVGVDTAFAPARTRLLGVTVTLGAAVLVLLVATLIKAGRADAFLHRGHSFETALETTGANKLAAPSAVAVDEATGDVYVADQGNNRVVRFGPNHEFLEAWGLGVGGGAEYERCSSEAACKPGIAGLGGPTKPQFDEPPAIAVDNSSGSPSKGDVYVVANRTWKKAIVYKFDPEGKLIGSLISKEEKEELWPVVGIAVDASGTVWLDREDEEEDFVIERFNDALKNQLIGEPEEIELPEVVGIRRPARPGFDVDSLGRVYVTFELGGRDIEEEEELIEERNEERKEHKEKKVEEAIAQPCVRHECVVARFAPGEGTILDEEAEVANFQPETNTTGIVTDHSIGTQSSGDVYLDHATGIAAFTSGGTLIQELGQSQLHDGQGLALDSATNELFAADAAAARVDVYQAEPAGPPTIRPGSVSFADLTATSAKVEATIDPTGADTHYFVRYGVEPCSTGPSACPNTTPAPPGVDLGAGFGDRRASVELTGLTPDTRYYVVVVATNEAGGKPVEVLSEERTKLLASAFALPDERAWELVSPSDKRGVAIEPLTHEGGLIQSAIDGSALTFVAAAPVSEEEPQGNRAPELSQFVATRQSPGNWSTQNITTPNVEAQGIQANERREYQFFNEDLSLAALFPPEPLSSSQTTEPASGLPIYLRETACRGEHCYAPVPGTASLPGHSSLDAATPDLKHLGINIDNVQGLFEWSAEESQPGEGHVRLVSVLPNGKPATGNAGFGYQSIEANQGSRNAISSDGSTLAWVQELTEGAHLYQTHFNAGKAETVQVDEQNVEGGLAPPTVPPNPIYQTSSVSGDRLFFTDDQRLTANASFGENPLTEQLEENENAGDLYVFEGAKPAGQRLTDLTPDLHAGESSAVQYGVIGASEDGSYVYFVANGVLAENASPGRCGRTNLPSDKCNLYEVHNNGAGWEKPRLIARISNEDLPDTGDAAQSRTEQYKVHEMTARVSPNGQFLAFMSDQPLTGYDNLDANSGQPDEEVFLFDAAGGGHLHCASCNPSGTRPIGVHDVEESGEGNGLLVDRAAIWSTEVEETPNSHWLAGSLPGWTNLDDRESLYQSRYLSNSGRLFFDSSDALVRQDVNGKEDVYEYEPTGVGSCATENTDGGCVALISAGTSPNESAFLDASESGSNVFFLTTSQLAPQDTDKAFDIYDARVCEGSEAEEPCPTSAEPSPPPCTGEACRPAPKPAHPSFSELGSATTSSSGNVTQQQVLGTKQAQPAKPSVKPPTRAQKLAAALRSCKRKYKHSKKKRQACERQARKRYGAKKASKSAKGHR